jgi:hypothetical protein
MIEGIMTRCHRRTGFLRHPAATVLGRHVGDVVAVLLAITEVLAVARRVVERVLVVVNVLCRLRRGDGEVLIQQDCWKFNKEIIKKAFGILNQIYIPEWLSCLPSFLPHLYG